MASLNERSPSRISCKNIIKFSGWGLHSTVGSVTEKGGRVLVAGWPYNNDEPHAAGHDPDAEEGGRENERYEEAIVALRWRKVGRDGDQYRKWYFG
jgi:hypothetical protein